MITPFYSLVFIRIHEILIHSQFHFYFAKNEVKYQDIDGNGVFTYPPILFFFFEHFSIADTLKINQSLQNLSLLISILSQKNIFRYGHKGKNRSSWL